MSSQYDSGTSREVTCSMSISVPVPTTEFIDINKAKPLRDMPISKHTIPYRALTNDHLYAVIGPGKNAENDVELTREKLKQSKKEATAFFSMRIKKRVVENARLSGIIHPKSREIVTFFSEIGLDFRAYPTLKKAKLLFSVYYGWFDTGVDWLHDLETEFMHKRGLRYSDSNNMLSKGGGAVSDQMLSKGAVAGKGRQGTSCLHSIICAKKADLWKGLMKVAKGKHGYYIKIKQPRQENGAQAPRRDKGKFYKAFIHRDMVYAKDNSFDDQFPWVHGATATHYSEREANYISEQVQPINQVEPLQPAPKVDYRKELLAQTKITEQLKSERNLAALQAVVTTYENNKKATTRTAKVRNMLSLAFTAFLISK
jgi:hypothetical protein